MLTDAQRKERQSAIYASDMPDILTDETTKNIVIAEKAGLIVPQNLDGLDHIEAGNRLELPLAHWAADRVGLRYQACDKTLADSLSCLRGHVDGFLLPGSLGLEIKCVGWGGAKDWQEAVPLRVYIQCQTYMAITDYPQWLVFALITSTNPREYFVERDNRAIEVIRSEANETWKLVEATREGKYDPLSKIDPATPQAQSAVKRMNSVVRADDDEPIELSPELGTIFRERKKLKEEISEKEKRLAHINASLGFAMKDASYGVCKGVFSVRKSIVHVKACNSYKYMRTTFKEINDE